MNPPKYTAIDDLNFLIRTQKASNGCSRLNGEGRLRNTTGVSSHAVEWKRLEFARLEPSVTPSVWQFEPSYTWRCMGSIRVLAGMSLNSA